MAQVKDLLVNGQSRLVGNTNINGNLTVGGVINSSGAITAPSFSGTLSVNNLSGQVSISHGGTESSSSNGAISNLYNGCTQGTNPRDSEIIVTTNGSGTSWKYTLSTFYTNWMKTKIEGTIVDKSKALVDSVNSNINITISQSDAGNEYGGWLACWTSGGSFKTIKPANVTGIGSAKRLVNDASEASATRPVYFSNGVPVACTYSLNKTVPSDAVFTDTHCTTGIVAGASGATANGTTNNINTYINVKDNSTYRSGIKITGTDGTSVKAAGGVITIDSHDSTYAFTEGTTNGTFNVSVDSGNASAVKIHGLGTAAFKNSGTGANDVAPGTGSTGIKTLASTITLGDGNGASILQNGATYQQKLEIVDDSTVDTAVFKFSQSSDSGSTWKNLAEIRDNGSVVATNFIGVLKGNVTGNCSGSSGSCTGNAANVTGKVEVAHGGTGATTAAEARTNLGLGSMATQSTDSYVPKSGGTFSGSITATSFNVSSARKFKENIHPTSFNGLDTINKAEVVDYNYIADTNKDPKVGLIADDCPAILAAPDRMSLDMNNCIGVLMKAVQELSEQNKELTRRIEILEEKVN